MFCSIGKYKFYEKTFAAAAIADTCVCVCVCVCVWARARITMCECVWINLFGPFCRLPTILHFVVYDSYSTYVGRELRTKIVLC